ncbi:hypothetical protein H0A58_01740 [Alcaligenaceae bacterium]|nr:hypothetical protein [Alcaligenaceae bacterium]
MTTRQYTAQFFQVNTFTLPDNDKIDAFWNLFTAEKARYDTGGAATIARSPSGYSFELREINLHQGVITGCLALLGSDAPHIRDINGDERKIETQPGDQFLQKNYFIYSKASRLLVWQFNLAANHVNNFGIMLTTLSGNIHTVVCNVLLDDAFGFDPTTAEIQYVDFRVREPRTNAEREQVRQLNPNSWGVDPFETMTRSNSSTFSLVLQTRKASAPKLANWVGDMVEKLWGSGQTRRLRVKVSDATEPLDLLAKRIKRRITVEMNGLYPEPTSVLQQLQEAKDECNDEIERSL